MRLTVVSLVLAGLAIQQTAAVPIRVVVVTSKQVSTGNVPDHDHGIPTFLRPVEHSTSITKAMANKAAEQSAAIAQLFRDAFGLGPHTDCKEADPIRILPFVGTPGPVISASTAKDAFASPPFIPLTVVKAKERAQDKGWEASRISKDTFVTRLDYALTALGTWEGRAVAFVLGCGIGVLLRMVFILGVVLLRGFGGSKNEVSDSEHVLYDAVVLFEESEQAPPEYTAVTDSAPVDEKKDVAVSAGSD